jgi:chaperonin GroEL
MVREYGDLVQRGIIDLAKVVRAVLQDAVGVAGMILSTDALIAEFPEPRQDSRVLSPEIMY